MTDTSLFDRFSSIDNLRNAWIKAKNYASTEYIFFDDFAFTEFSEHLDVKLLSLSFDLSHEKYIPVPIRYISIPKGDKQRKVYFASPRDTVVMQALMNVIGPIFESKFSQMSFGNRLNVGSDESKETYHAWRDQYSSYLSTVRSFWDLGTDAWYAITDIENFYPTVSIDWLLGLIDKQTQDERILNLLTKVLNIKAIDASGSLEDVSGLPPGVIYSHFFANIYLDEFDTIAIKNSLAYARFVDDICFLCKDKESLENLYKKLNDLLSHWNQGFKNAKTVKRQNSDIGPLLEHTRRMKYANRLDFSEILEVDDQAISSIMSAEKPFYKLYKIAEKEGDLSKLVEEAGEIIRYLKKVNPAYLRDIISSLIDLHPLKPSTLKTAICSLLETEIHQQNDEFWKLISKKILEDHYFTLIFLQLVSYYELDAERLLSYLLSCCDSSHILIRATAYYEIWKFLKHEKGIIDVIVINALIERENDLYAINRLIYCYTGIKSNFVGLSVFSLVDPIKKELLFPAIRSISSLIHDKKLEPNNFLTVWAKIKDIPHFSPELFTEIFFLASKYQMFWIIEAILLKSPYQSKEQLKQVISAISLEIIEDFSLDANYVSLFQYSDFLSSLDLKVEANIGFEEIRSGTNDNALRERLRIQQTQIPAIEPKINLPDWTTNQLCSQYTYRHQRGDNDYFCRYYEDELGHSGILEIISKERIENRGFSSVSEWVDYLKSLIKQEIIPSSLIMTNDDQNPQSYYFYEIPEGFSSISKLLKHTNAEGLLGKNIIFKIAANLANILRKTQREGFIISSIDPLSVFWNPTNEKLLIANIGSCLGAARFDCGISGCSDYETNEEIGISAAYFHLGLLMLQMLKKECPVRLVNSTKSRYGEKLSIYDLFSDIDLLPHQRYILGRLLNSDPNYRYSNNSWLEKDFIQANLLLEYINKFGTKDNNGSILSLKLMDFLVFRLRIISRNPNLLNMPPLVRNQKTIEELSASFQYLPKEMLDCWPIINPQKPTNVIFPSSKEIKNISPEGRRLLEITHGWEKLSIQNQAFKVPTSQFTLICLYQVLAIEVQATLGASLEIAVAEEKERLVNKADEIIKTIYSQFIGEEALELKLKSDYFQNKTNQIEITKDQLGELKRFFEEVKNPLSNQRLPKPGSLITFSLIYTFLGLPVEIFHKNHLIYKTTQVLKFGKKPASAKDIWSFLFEFRQLDQKIRDLQIINNYDYTNEDARRDATSALEHFPAMLRAIRSLNSANRVPAEIYSLQPRNFYFESDGYAEVFSVIPRIRKPISFDTSHVFISGNPALGDIQKRRPIRLDLVRPKGNSIVAVSVLAPIGRFIELPFGNNRFTPYRISVLFRKLPVLAVFLILIISLALSSIFLNGINLLIGNLVSPLIPSAISFVISVINALRTKFFDGMLATLKPEDADEYKKEKPA